MKKTGLLLLLAASIACAQSAPVVTSTMAATPNANGILESTVSIPFVRYQTPTQADIYCAGFISKDRVPDANYVNGGLQTPSSTKFELGQIVYLAGTGYQAGQLYSIVRELRDVNEYEIYSGMRRMLRLHRPSLQRSRTGSCSRHSQPSCDCPGGVQLRSHQPWRRCRPLR